MEETCIIVTAQSYTGLAISLGTDMRSYFNDVCLLLVLLVQEWFPKVCGLLPAAAFLQAAWLVWPCLCPTRIGCELSASGMRAAGSRPSRDLHMLIVNTVANWFWVVGARSCMYSHAFDKGFWQCSQFQHRRACCLSDSDHFHEGMKSLSQET